MLIDHLIVEAQNYEQMFGDIFKLNPDPRLRRQIADGIDWARRTLRKNDRIVWFLRWMKLSLSPTGASPGVLGTTNSGVSQRSAPGLGTMQQYNRRFATAYAPGDVMPVPALKQRLEHFLSLPVPEIQSHVFQAESPRQLFDLFARFEAAWRQRTEEEQSLVTPQSGDEVLIEFPDGFAWWLLPRGGCPVEAAAMGHCGNVPSQRPGERILSLRRRVQRGDIARWYPVATFILDRDGQLGEMKGRGNDKPAPKYHPYIAELLRHRLISGIKGGGYMPENNFAMSDLDPQTRAQLIRQKPALKGLLSYYEEEGMTDRVLAMLDQRMAGRGLPEYESFDRAKREFVLSTYRDLEQFVGANSDEVLEQLLELRDRADDSQSDVHTAGAKLDADTLRRFLEMLPGRAFADIAKSVGIDPTTSNAKRLVAGHLQFQGGPMFDRIEHAFAAGSGHEAIVRRLDARIAQYVNEGWSFECSYAYLAFVNPSNLPGSAIEIRVAEWDLVYMATAEVDGDDDEHAYAEFGDAENIKFDTDDLIDAAVETYLNPRKYSPTIPDRRQLTLHLEELRRRAGLGRVFL